MGMVRKRLKPFWMNKIYFLFEAFFDLEHSAKQNSFKLIRMNLDEWVVVFYWINSSAV